MSKNINSEHIKLKRQVSNVSAEVSWKGSTSCLPPHRLDEVCSQSEPLLSDCISAVTGSLS